MSTSKTALVTGSSRGLGKAIADLLENRGCNVIRTSTKEFDFLNKIAFDDFISSVRFRKIDILVNNAAIRKGTKKDIFQVNFYVPKKLMDVVIPYMKEKGEGHIINISSIASIMPDRATESYALSKTSLSEITREMALKCAQNNILINAILPGIMETDMMKNNLSKKQQERWKHDIPLVRFAKVEEVAKVVVFLCLDNTYITGQNIIVDGGFMAR
jgi:3-oxoacyl-[acyl-carrier protein] reductase